MIITKDSHVDHGLRGVHIELLFQLFGARKEFFIEQARLVSQTAGVPLPGLPCMLYGPIMGDGPVPESLIHWKKRGDRDWADRVFKEPNTTVPLSGAQERADHAWSMRESHHPQAPGFAQGRLAKTMTVIAGPHAEHPCILFTAYGGPLAPKSVSDPSIGPSEDERKESVAFWAEHALLVPEAR